MRRAFLLAFGAVVFTFLGYVLGHLYPFPLWDFRGDISGNVELRVVALTDKGQPVEKLAIGISRKPYTAPDIGGEGTTDKNGVAIFMLISGKYYLGVGSESIPQGLVYNTPPFPIQVQGGEINEQKIILISE